jgi:hypothetical protein
LLVFSTERDGLVGLGAVVEVNRVPTMPRVPLVT